MKVTTDTVSYFVLGYALGVLSVTLVFMYRSLKQEHHEFADEQRRNDEWDREHGISCSGTWITLAGDVVHCDMVAGHHGTHTRDVRSHGGRP